MKSTWKAKQIERKDDIKAINEVLDVLNCTNTSVTVQDNEYVIKQNNVKKFEVTLGTHDALIRAFEGDKPGKVRCTLGEGINVKAKLWLLKFVLREATEPNAFEQFAEKVKIAKSDIDMINKVLTALMREDTRVYVDHETNVMKKYVVLCNIKNQEYKLIIEYVGFLVKFTENGIERTVNAEGYMGWKLGVLRKDLDKKMAPHVPFKTRLAQKLKNRQY